MTTWSLGQRPSGTRWKSSRATATATIHCPLITSISTRLPLGMHLTRYQHQQLDSSQDLTPSRSLRLANPDWPRRHPRICLLALGIQRDESCKRPYAAFIKLLPGEVRGFGDGEVESRGGRGISSASPNKEHRDEGTFPFGAIGQGRHAEKRTGTPTTTVTPEKLWKPQLLHTLDLGMMIKLENSLKAIKDRVQYLVDVEGEVKRRFALKDPDLTSDSRLRYACSYCVDLEVSGNLRAST
ncbi:hypothetical protein BJ508DRAFT_127677 [Ascobolus immersus RN42]|uniref:Uncharacterized protein n=1 Tax=Ascobolus immersus RN42 TaxID=1160509 RepID=A0A3N4I322_ASCIM|nr:hypothetical protein BJ508DRAFT_127677 [Ascobolus immersus RN42]